MNAIISRALRLLDIDEHENKEWYKVSFIAVDQIVLTIMDAVTYTEEEVVHIITCNPDGTDMRIRSTTWL